MDDTWWRSADQLDTDQAELISLPLGGSHLIVGPPGSGKTNILLLRATYLTRAGQSNIGHIRPTVEVGGKLNGVIPVHLAQ